MKALNIGCHDIKLSGFLNIDLDPTMAPDLVWDCTKLRSKFEDGSISFINAGHFLEHFDVLTGKRIVQDCFALLAPYGVLGVTCPDHTKVDGLSIAEKERILFAEGDHKVLMDATRMEEYLREAGFRTVVSMPPEQYGFCPFPGVKWQTVTLGIKHQAFAQVFGYDSGHSFDTSTLNNCIPAINVKPSLEALATKYHTDKLDHGFIPYYESYLKNHPVKRLLEIGVYQGASLKMWRDYFPEAHVLGWDISSFPLGCFGEHIETKIVDQESSSQMVQAVNLPQGISMFDVIIDDGKHSMKAQQTTLGTLWPYLNDGGIFIVEDLHTSLPNNPYEWAGGGCRPDFSNSSLVALLNLQERGTFISEYMTPEQIGDITSSLEFCHVIDVNGDERHITAILKKKAR